MSKRLISFRFSLCFSQKGCVGRQLGLMELRLFIARFVQTFDATFAVSFRFSIQDREKSLVTTILVDSPLSLLLLPNSLDFIPLYLQLRSRTTFSLPRILFSSTSSIVRHRFNGTQGTFSDGMSKEFVATLVVCKCF